MTRVQFARFIESIVRELRKVAPRDTGNLADNAIVYWYEGDKAIIEVKTNIAPYMPYTNEPWVSPRWNGKKNPNEAWWQTRVPIVLNKVVKRYNGVLTDENGKQVGKESAKND